MTLCQGLPGRGEGKCVGLKQALAWHEQGGEQKVAQSGPHPLWDDDSSPRVRGLPCAGRSLV